MPRWIEICTVDDLPRAGARVVRRAHGADVAVFRTAGDRIFALLDRCPHKGGPLSQGIVFGERVACPLHAWTIALDSGEAAAPDRGCARRFTVYLEAGRVHLDADELARTDAPQAAHDDVPRQGGEAPGGSDQDGGAAASPANAADPNGLSAPSRVAPATAG